MWLGAWRSQRRTGCPQRDQFARTTPGTTTPARLLVIGANGDGKTTWARVDREVLSKTFYHADSITEGLVSRLAITDGAAHVDELERSVHPLSPHQVGSMHMATSTPDIHDALVKAGVDDDAATDIARRLTRRAGPSAMSILTAATLAGFGLLAIGIGWVKSDMGELRAELRTEIAANRARIDAVETRLAGDIADLSERMTRIETLLEERLPPRR